MTPPAPASSGKTSGRIAPWVGSILFPLTLYIAGFLVFFRGQLFSDLDLVFGDRGDARFVAFIHEHVYRWLQGGAELLSPPFFFNQTRTLGYSDAFLLDQLIYAPLRLLGAEPLLALSLVAMILSPVAFFFVYVLLRRLDVSVALASLGALLFTFPSNLFLKSGHLQHFAVYYIPVIAYCSWVAVVDLHRRPLRAYLLAAFAAGLYGLVFSTGYYMAWFFGLGLLIFAPIAVYFAWPQVRNWWGTRPTRVLGLSLAAILSFVAALSLFAAIYAPVLATGAARGFGEYLAFAPTPFDLFNVGRQNLVWSDLIRSLHLVRDDRLGDGGEFSIALTPVVQMLLALSAVLALRPGFWSANDASRISRAFVIASASVCALFFLLTIKVHNFSLFRVLYVVVPGAKAIRVGYRGMVMANLFAVTAIGLTFTQLIRPFLSQPLVLPRVGKLAACAAVLALAAIEQVNLTHSAHLSRNFERLHLAAVGNSLGECHTFYAAPQPDHAPYEVQIDAMMVAQAQHLPTINGYSGIMPPHWNFYDANAPDYQARAVRWAVKRDIAEGLCRLDVERGTWTLVAQDSGLICASGGCPISFGPSHEFEIDLRQGGNSAVFEDDYWAGAEPWGQWTDATKASLSFFVGTPRDLAFAVSVRGLLSARAPKQSVWIEANHCWVGERDFDLAQSTEPQVISGSIPAKCIDADGKLVLRINTDRARTPRALGINDDRRTLGVGVDHVVIRESGPVPQGQ
jgi:hypothetical protein